MCIRDRGSSLFYKMKNVSLIRIWCMLRHARHVSCISRMTYDNWSPSWSEHCPFQDTGLTNPIFQHWHVQLQLAKWQAIESPSFHTQWTRTRCLDWRFHTTSKRSDRDLIALTYNAMRSCLEDNLREGTVTSEDLDGKHGARKFKDLVCDIGVTVPFNTSCR